MSEPKQVEPNPGTKEAIKAGCTCPVLDNAHGRGCGEGLFWYTEGCPIHTMEADDDQT